MSVIQEVKERIDAVELIGEVVKLRRSGNSFIGFCPFHDNKNTPAFVVWPDSGNWRCFGACSEGGDVFRFVMKKEGWEFGEALRQLAQRAGVVLQPRTPQQEARAERNDQLRRLLELASTYYQHLLQHNPQASPAREHLAQRGLTAAAIESFELGYALESWDAGLTYFREKGYTPDELVAAGLVVQKEAGRTFDRFRNRIMIPIRDERGRLAGFGARIVDPADFPKFMNSPQTELFNKGDLLYGLDRARRPIREQGEAVVVEGYLDVIAAHSAGFVNVVSPMGTALTEQQLRQLRRYTRRLVLALDPDVAGDQAALRGLDVARRTLDREALPAFDPRGLVRNEGQLRLDIRVATLPGDLDPDELIAQDPAAWRELIAAAQPVVDYVIATRTAGQDLRDPKVKAAIANDVLPIINDVSHPVERSAYRQKLARLLRIDERALVGETARRARGRRARRSSTAVAAGRPALADQPGESGLDELESYYLAALLRAPDLLAHTERHLRELGLAPLVPEDFASTGLQLIFSQLQGALHQAEADPLEYLQDRLDEALQEQLERLLDLGQGLDLDEERRVDDLLSAAVRLRRRNVGLWLQELRFLQEAAQETGDANALAYQEEIVGQVAALQRIQRALSRRSRREAAANHLSVW